jgi:hypothetical protein
MELGPCQSQSELSPLECLANSERKETSMHLPIDIKHVTVVGSFLTSSYVLRPGAPPARPRA